MTRTIAVVWLLLVSLAALHAGGRLWQGVTLQTDLMALLPREEQDKAAQYANEIVTRSLSRRVVVLFGHAEREQARAAAAALSASLSELAELTTPGVDKGQLASLGALYFPYRGGLLAEADRQRLLAGHGQEVAERALSQAFGFITMDGGLLRNDPFLLLPAFFAGLPQPQSQVTLDDGVPTVVRDGKTWVLVAAQLNAEPFATAVQERVERLVEQVRERHGGVELLRLGAVFFARAAADQAMSEASTLGTVSILATMVLILLVFRALSPLWLSLLTIGVGALVSFSVCLWLFGSLHAAALLIGTSLIGVAVDYPLHYFVDTFSTPPEPPRDRLRTILPGLFLGMITSVAGYATLLLAPFPGFQQVAAFSAIGLMAAFITLVAWVPLLDRLRPVRHGGTLVAAAGTVWSVWERPRLRWFRLAVLAAAVLAGMAGLMRLQVDDDVRRLQSMSPVLLAEQARIQALLGADTANQFFLVQAADEETALRREEALAERLIPLRAAGALAGFRSPADFVPSAERQLANRHLVRERLDHATHLRRLGLDATPPAEDGVLTLAAAKPAAALLSGLVLPDDHALHVVALDGITRLDAVAAAATGLEGVRFVDPAADFGRLLGRYRARAIWLAGLSVIPILGFLAWRYGLRAALAVMAPPLLATVLTPALKALAGAPLTFFDAIALVLVLSIGVDYAVFCAESSTARRAVTMLGILLSGLTTLLSFGLLALSSVTAVRAFGSTMMIGIALAFVFAPLAAPDRIGQSGEQPHDESLSG